MDRLLVAGESRAIRKLASLWRFQARHSSSEPSKNSKAWMILANLRNLSRPLSGWPDDTHPEKDRLQAGRLLGSVSGELGLRKYLEGVGHTLSSPRDKDGDNSGFDREIPDAEIVISQPFWPA